MTGPRWVRDGPSRRHAMLATCCASILMPKGCGMCSRATRLLKKHALAGATCCSPERVPKLIRESLGGEQSKRGRSPGHINHSAESGRPLVARGTLVEPVPEGSSQSLSRRREAAFRSIGK